MAKATVAISQDFFNSFAALPKSKQNKVMEFLSKFRSNPEANGFNYEKMNTASKLAMKAFVGSLKKKSDEKSKEMAELISGSYDISDVKFVEPIVAYLKGE